MTTFVEPVLWERMINGALFRVRIVSFESNDRLVLDQSMHAHPLRRSELRAEGQ